MNQRSTEALLGDLAEAIDATAELVALGKARWDSERPLRLAGEAVIGRIGDVATKLPAELVAGTAEIPWAEVKGMRIVVDHAYHSIDYERVGGRCAMTFLGSAVWWGGGPTRVRSRLRHEY